MRTGSVSFSVTALQPHRWAGGLSYHCSRIALFFRIANADIHTFRIANAEERGVIVFQLLQFIEDKKNDIMSRFYFWNKD